MNTNFKLSPQTKLLLSDPEHRWGWWAGKQRCDVQSLLASLKLREMKKIFELLLFPLWVSQVAEKSSLV
jgi:hypothetical protein